MPTTECAAENIAPPESPTQCALSDDAPTDLAPLPPGRASKPLKGLLFGFAATVTLGLALASWYVAVRIVATGEAVASSLPVRAKPAPLPAAPPAAQEASWHTVPTPAELYLQVAGLGSAQDASFVASLQAQGFRAQVQTRLDETRILIGPFSSRDEIEQARLKLQSAGVLAAEVTH